MKKCLITFIIATISIIPIYNVKALTGYDNNIYPDLPNDGHTTSHYVILKSTEDDIALIYYPNSLITTYNNNDNYVSVGFGDRFNFGGWYTSGYSRKVYLYLLDKDNNVWKYRGYDDYGVGNATLLSSINSDIANNLDVFDSYIYQDIVYSNVNFYVTYGNNNASIYNHEKSYMYYQTKTLDNSYAFIFTTNNYNSNYKYQIKFNNNSWLDISKALSNNGHSHTIKENGTLHMQILNENNDVIFSRSILITSFKSNKPLIKANFDNNNYYDDNLNIIPNYSTNNTDFSKNIYYTGDTSLQLKGSSNSNLQYNVNLDSTFDLTFYYYKNDSSSYSRLIYLGGLNREVEIKGSSKNMYINKEITTNWKNKEWNKFRVTRDANDLISYYSNGELIFTETSSTVISYIRFGYGSSSSSNLFNGFIDDISLYNKIYDGKEEESNPIEYTQEKIVQDGTVYNDYYKFTLFTSSYNKEYTYKYKIGNGAWIDVSSTIENSVNFNVFYNSTVYMAVVDNEGNYVYTTTYTINDLLEQKEYETPSVSYDVSYGEEFKTGLKYANVTFKIKNYSAAFSYHYSLDDTNDIIINNRDIVDSEYTYKTYQNVTIYFYVYDLDGNVVFNNSYTLTGVTNYDKLYTYEIPISDFYDKENNKLKYLTLYYESSKNSTEDIYLSLSTFLAYSDLQPTKTKIPFYFINKNKVTDLQDYVNNIDFSYFTYFDLPYEYLTSTTNYFNYTSYNVFTLLPYYDFQNKVESSSKVIIKSNVELKILGYKETDYFYEFTTNGSDYEYFSNLINKILTPIYEKLPILGQFKEIYKTFNYDYHHDTIPRYTVDLSYFGGDSETTVIDFTNFIDYRMYIFNFIKILLAYETLRVVIKNIKNSGGDS